MDNNFERELDKMVEADLERAKELKNQNDFETEIENAEDPCCDECGTVGVFKLKE